MSCGSFECDNKNKIFLDERVIYVTEIDERSKEIAEHYGISYVTIKDLY